MRHAAKRSLSSILRSNLLTTIINNDVSGKVNASSPDFNPIEQAWSKLKQQLRGVKARVLEQLEPAIADALSAITAHNARAFRHCGYGIQQL